MKRIFIALPFDRKAANRLKAARDTFNKYSGILKTVSPEAYHITLKFFGEVSAPDCEILTESFKQLRFDLSPVNFTLQGLGYFKGPSGPSVIWAGFNSDISNILKIYQGIELFSSEFGYKKEKREFIPHLTLGRIKKNKKCPGNLIKYLENNKDTFFFESEFKKVVLFNSELTKNGPEYKELASIELK